MNVYFISGLGADRRVFKYIRVPDGFTARFIDWVPPKEKETLTDYAMRLTEQMDLTKPFALVGLSLGGIISVEIAKRYPAVSTMLISSIPLSDRMPSYFYLGKSLRLVDIIPIGFFKRAALAKRLFSAESDPDRVLMRQLIHDADPVFMRWAMYAVLRWKNKEVPERLWQIHGTHDIVFPVHTAKPNATKPNRLVKKAGHLMVMTHADEVNGLLKDVLTMTA